jgi:hypothetical protein
MALITKEKSLKSFGDYGTLSEFCVTNTDDGCFCCGKELTFPFIYWLGRHNMSFCPKCAEHMFQGIFLDLYNYKKGKWENAPLPEYRRKHYKPEFSDPDENPETE